MSATLDRIMRRISRFSGSTHPLTPYALLVALSGAVAPWGPAATAATLHTGDLVILGGAASAGVLQRVDPLTGAVTPIALAPTGALDVTVGPRQDVYILAGAAILRIDAQTGITTPVSSGGWLTQAQRLVREPSGSLLVLTTELPAEPSSPPPGFHWSRVVRIDPAAGSQTVLAEGGYLDRIYPSVGEGSRDLDVLADGRIVVARYWAGPILYTVDPVTGAQSVMVDAPEPGGGWIADWMAVAPDGSHAYAADWGQCWCTHVIDVATGISSLAFGYGPPGGIGHAGDVAVGWDGTAYNIGYNTSDAGTEYLLSRWNPASQNGAVVAYLDAWAGAIDVVPPPECADGSDNDGDGLSDYPDDLGCGGPTYAKENPQCNDGIDNDGDGLIDYPSDPGCAGFASNDFEVSRSSCGLGAELAAVLLALAWRRTKGIRPQPVRTLPR